jgi:hypothetical protein
MKTAYLFASLAALSLVACADDKKPMASGAAASGTMAAAPASASTMRMGATLSGREEVPAVNTQGSGQADVMFDRATKKLSWTVNYSGLSGPPTMAHFHAGKPGANGPVAVPIASGPTPSPMKGEATLNDAQVQQLMAGDMYVNIHTNANKGGEIRGQVTPR